MNRWTAEVLLHNQLGWWGYDYADDQIEMESWDELVQDFMDAYPNRNAAYADGVPRPSKEFWQSHVAK